MTFRAFSQASLVLVAVAASLWPSSRAAAGNLPGGVIQVLGKCLEVRPTDHILRHELLRLAACTGAANQRFNFGADGAIRLLGWCLDIPNSDAEDHAQIQLFDCRKQANQRFSFSGWGELEVMGKCVDVPNSNAADGAQLQLFNCNGGENQSFHFIDDGR